MTITFIDVGAHEGQTLEEVIKPQYGFDQIIAFEPMPRQFEILNARFGGLPRVTLLNCGLSDHEGSMPIYGTNEHMEASIFKTKRDLVKPESSTECYFREASPFIDSLDGTIIMKLNCEGAEVVILKNLVERGAIWRIANVMIDFDIRKIPGQEHREREVLESLRTIGFDRYSLCENVMHGATHQDRIANWLHAVKEIWARA
jgi:FkbM family methyltransferase